MDSSLSRFQSDNALLDTKQWLASQGVLGHNATTAVNPYFQSKFVYLLQTFT